MRTSHDEQNNERYKLITKQNVDNNSAGASIRLNNSTLNLTKGECDCY